MAGIKELIIVNDNGTISFGDYTLSDKAKKDDFKFEGDSYKVKTHGTVTKLEKNGVMLYESVPGTAVHNFLTTDASVSFQVEGANDAQITLELEPDVEYKLFLDNTNIGKMKTNLAGKLNISIELDKDAIVPVKVIRS